MIRGPIAAIVLGAALVASACGTQRPGSTATTYTPTEQECIDRFRTLPGHPSRARYLERPSQETFRRLAAAGPPWRTDFRRHLVSLCEVRSGGVPRDGIPPIDHPRPVALRLGDRFLGDREPVVAVTLHGQARAYPLEILVWHEIVNDRLDGTPIAVTYCPLCNSAVVFDRRVAGRALQFGTTGDLRNSDLVMWDTRTQSWWQQVTGEALVGRYAGTRLRALNSRIMSWSAFEARYPQGSVLSRRTGYERPYGTTPYAGYERAPGRPALYSGRLDARLPARERVLAVYAGSRVGVVAFSRLSRSPVLHTRLGRTPVVVLYERDVASALDSPEVRSARDVGAAAAFVPRARGRSVDLVQGTAPGTFRDRRTGSTWDVSGRAIAGPLAGARLRTLRSTEQFWFSLAAFVPGARLLAAERPPEAGPHIEPVARALRHSTVYVDPVVTACSKRWLRRRSSLPRPCR